YLPFGYNFRFQSFLMSFCIKNRQYFCARCLKKVKEWIFALTFCFIWCILITAGNQTAIKA
ncbi:MAG: hypothetical protein K2O52_00220, partial [Oscillospiraceae bacterium]|nr:hypothetical protein [Oscillospiraceae bacterium]